MNLLWYEIKFSEVDLSRGKSELLISEINKLYKILDHIDGIALYAGKYKKNIGQKFFLTVPDNNIGRNLAQYLKLKNYIPCVEPKRDEITYECGSHTKGKINPEVKFTSALMHLN